MKRFVAASLLVNCGLFASSTWNSTTTSSMVDGNNWLPATTPPPNEILIFPFSASLVKTVNNNISSPYAVGSMTISDAYTISGNGFSIGTNQPLIYGASGSLFNFNGMTLNSGTTWTISSVTGGNTIQSDISGGGNLTLATGKLSLTGTNTYTGSTSIQGGATLAVSNLSGTSGLDFFSSMATLQALQSFTSTVPMTLTGIGAVDTNGNTVALNGQLSGASAFNKFGLGTLTLGGANNYTGETIVNAGELAAGSTTAFGNNSNVNVIDGTLSLGSNSVTINTLSGGLSSSVDLGTATLTVANGSIYPFYGTITGSGNILLSAGTLTLMSSNTYTGTTTLNGGSTLNIYDLGTTSSLQFTSGGGNVQLGSTTSSTTALVVNAPATIGTNTFDVALSGGITGNGSTLTKIGLGKLTLTGANTNAGSIQIEGGILNLTPTSLGSATSLVFSTFGGTFQAGNAFSGANAIAIPITLTTPGTFDTNGNNVTLNGPVSGPSNFTKTGLGILTFGSSGNNYTGKTIIQNGVLAANSLAQTSQLVFAGSGSGTYETGAGFTGFLTPSASVVFMSSGAISATGSSDFTISNVIAGNAGSTFSKAGTGRITLSGLNIYVGPTNVAAGTLRAGVATTSSGGAFGIGSNMTVSSGATLDFNNFASTIGSLTNAGSVDLKQGTVSPTSFSQSSGGTLNLDFLSLTTYGNIQTAGTISLNGSLVITNTGGASPTLSSQFILLQSSGAANSLSGTFASVTNPFPGGTISYNYTTNQVLMLFGNPCQVASWTSTSSGNWDTSSGSNWSSGCVNGPGAGALPSDSATATFGNITPVAVTITMADATGSAAQSVTLFNMNFNASNTAYTINPYDVSKIILDAPGVIKPQISQTAGNHTLNAPITLNQDSAITLSGGTLTLGNTSIITTTSSKSLNISQGSGFGTLANYGTSSPFNLTIDGGKVDNYALLSPSNTLTIAAKQSNANTMVVNNVGTMLAGSTTTIGGTGLNNGPLILTNSGTIGGVATLTIISGTVNNISGGAMNPASGGTFAITGGLISNDGSSTLGLPNSNINFTGGSITNDGVVSAYNYTQGPSAVLNLNVQSIGNFGSVQVANTANLNGSLNIYAINPVSFADGDTIDLLTSVNPLITSFSSISYFNFPGNITPTVNYLTNAVQLSLAVIPPVPVIGTTQPVTAGHQNTMNRITQINSFVSLRSFQLRDRFQGWSGNKNKKKYASAFSGESPIAFNDQMDEKDEFVTVSNSRENSASVVKTANAMTRQKQGQLTENVSKAQPVEKPWRVYVGPTGGFGDVKGQHNQEGFHYHSYGALIGADYAFSNDNENRFCDFGLGALVDYKWTKSGRLFKTDAVHGSLYATLVPKAAPNLAFDATLGYGYDWITLHRQTGTTPETATGKTHANEFDAFFDVEYTFSHRSYPSMPEHLRIIPLISVQYAQADISGYTETGAGVNNLKVHGLTLESLTSVLGSRFNYLFTGKKFDFRTELDAGWQREYLNHDKKVGFTAFNTTNQTSTSIVYGPGRNSLLLELDLLATFSDRYQVEADAAYQLNSEFYNVSFYLGFGIIF